MMPMPLRLEVFETPETNDGPSLMMPDQIEDLRLNAYERGYVAGWEDGGTQHDAEAATRKLAIERRVEQLNFTYHEARGHLLKSIAPLFEAIVGTLLPTIARASVIPLVIEHLLPLAHAAAEAPVTLRISPGSRPGFDAAMAGQMLPPLDIVEADDLVEGQAEFAFGTAETRIDLTHAAARIQRAIEQFTQIQTEESHRA